MKAVNEAKPWFTQAESDLRTAKALHIGPEPMIADDIGCHVTAMCAQVVEKSIKGYFVVNGGSLRLNHRPDKYLNLLLVKGPLLRHKDHYAHLSKLFDAGTKHQVKALLELTPGSQDGRTDSPNTEYPWKIDGDWTGTPAGSSQFENAKVNESLKLAQRIYDTLRRLEIAASRGT